MCDFYMGGYKGIVQFKGSVTSRSGCCDYKFGKLGMGWVFLVQTDKKTDRQTNRKIDRQNDRKRGRENGRHTAIRKERQTGADDQTGTQKEESLNDRKTYRQIGKQTDRETDRKRTDRH